ncbi:hypothetical protein SKAU_G00222720 [Synaphobranchus kaupii]|uniref:Uncharacterized protein n=1 Tax=Synaphobranchus kaupii TaxID=118154 RepID=A0A9Q1IU03_SYNKA|nr:hypothetical protein SKAU_G00222720 [Synaphobranchus kaupii]
MMRAVSAVVLLCISALVVLAFQSIRQQLEIQTLQVRIAKATKQVRKEEDAIIQAKLKIQDINGLLSPVNSKKAELTKKKQDMSNAWALSLKNLQECLAEKTEADSTMHTAIDNLQNSKAKQGSDKLEADEEIKGLKKQILDRDKKLCEFVDMKVAEGRKLCGVAEAIK